MSIQLVLLPAVQEALIGQPLSSFPQGQEERFHQPFAEVGDEARRVVFPEAAGVSNQDALRVWTALEKQAPLPGFPDVAPVGGRITVALASEFPGGTDGWSSAVDGLIVLPLHEVFKWPSSKLYRVIRHELTHVAMEIFFNDSEARLPSWLKEGFAEWVAGELTREAEARIRLDLLARRARGQKPPRILESLGGRPSRLYYDLAATFIDYLDEESGGAVERGTFLESIKADGVEAGVLQTASATLEELEGRWQVHLLDRFGGS